MMPDPYPYRLSHGEPPAYPLQEPPWHLLMVRLRDDADHDCCVISDDDALTQARLWLSEACRIGLADALGLLGVSAPDEMARLDEDAEQ